MRIQVPPLSGHDLGDILGVLQYGDLIGLNGLHNNAHLMLLSTNA